MDPVPVAGVWLRRERGMDATGHTHDLIAVAVEIEGQWYAVVRADLSGAVDRQTDADGIRRAMTGAQPWPS
jgi:hypothetical protein